MKMSYKIIATYEENGTELLADRAYALGDYANQTWESREDAQAVADELAEDVGTVVDGTVKYEVVEE
jgi:hypothetical protein